MLWVYPQSVLYALYVVPVHSLIVDQKVYPRILCQYNSHIQGVPLPGNSGLRGEY